MAGFKDRIVSVEGGQLCCAYRPGDGPTLLLIPGTFSDSRAFAKLVPHLGADLNLLILEKALTLKLAPKLTRMLSPQQVPT